MLKKQTKTLRVVLNYWRDKMTKVVEMMSKQLEKKCSLKNILWAENFSDELNDGHMTRSKKRRVINFFVKKSPKKLLSALVRRGYDYENAICAIFTQRFGNLFILYRFKEVAGKLKVILLKIVKVFAKQLYAIAMRFSKKAEGGEIMHFNLFEVYACEPSLCVNPIDR